MLLHQLEGSLTCGGRPASHQSPRREAGRREAEEEERPPNGRPAEECVHTSRSPAAERGENEEVGVRGVLPPPALYCTVGACQELKWRPFSAEPLCKLSSVRVCLFLGDASGVAVDLHSKHFTVSSPSLVRICNHNSENRGHGKQGLPFPLCFRAGRHIINKESSVSL